MSTAKGPMKALILTVAHVKEGSKRKVPIL